MLLGLTAKNEIANKAKPHKEIICEFLSTNFLRDFFSFFLLIFISIDFWNEIPIIFKYQL